MRSYTEADANRYWEYTQHNHFFFAANLPESEDWAKEHLKPISSMVPHPQNAIGFYVEKHFTIKDLIERSMLSVWALNQFGLYPNLDYSI